MSRNRKLFISTIIGIISQVTAIICGLILPAAILKFYGSSANGLVNSIGQFLGFIQLCELGVGAVVQSALYKPLANGDTYAVSCVLKSSRSFFRIIGTILFLYVVLLCVIYPHFIEEFDPLFVMVMIVALSINSFSNYYFGMNNSLLLQADQRSYIPLGLQAIATILNTIVCLILINLGCSLLIVKFSTAIIYLIRPIVMQLYVNRKYAIDYSVIYENEPIKQKWNGLAQHVASVIVDHTDTVILTIFSTLQNVSIYTVYYMVVSSIRSMINSSLSGVQAAMGNMISTGEKRELNNFFNQAEWILHTMVILLYTITGILIVPFVLVYTKNVNDANYNVPVFAILIVIANAGFCLQSVYKLIVKAAGHYKQTQGASIIEAIINVVSSAILVFKFGLIGVTIGTILAMCYRLLYHVWYIKHNIIYRSYKPFVKQILVDFIVVFAIITAASFIPITANGYITWIISALLITALSCTISAVINLIFFREYLLGVIKKILRKLNRRM